MAEARAAFGADAAGVPGGFAEDLNLGAADGLEGGQAVLNLGDERGVFGIRGVDDLGEGEGDRDAVAGWDAGNAGAGGVGIGRDGDGVDEAEVDDVEGDRGVIAVAQRSADAGLGEGGGWSGCGHWLDDSVFEVRGSRFEALGPRAFGCGYGFTHLNAIICTLGIRQRPRRVRGGR